MLLSPSAAGTVVVLGCLVLGGRWLGGSCSWSHRDIAHGAWLSCDSHPPIAADTGEGIVTQKGTSLHPLTFSQSGEVSILQSVHGHPETHPAADGTAIGVRTLSHPSSCLSTHVRGCKGPITFQSSEAQWPLAKGQHKDKKQRGFPCYRGMGCCF